MMTKRRSGFKQVSACFKCCDCGKLTRDVDCNFPMCPGCNEKAMHENSHADNDFPGDNCGDPKCPVKDYSDAQRWWKK